MSWVRSTSPFRNDMLTQDTNDGVYQSVDGNPCTYLMVGFGMTTPNLQYVLIPAFVDVIPFKCFYKQTSIQMVMFEAGSSTRVIEKKAFMGSGVRVVHFPKEIEMIGEKCFYSCIDLEKVSFAPNCALTSINEKAFMNSGLHFLEIPRNVELIGEKCFSGCKNLKTMRFERDSQLKCFSRKMFMQSGIVSIVVPASVERISFKCFECAHELRSLSFEQCSSLKHIENDAFLGCSSFRELELPKSIETLGKFLFVACPLERLTFEHGVCIKRIERKSISSGSLRTIMIPNTVEFMGEDCFIQCFDLHEVFFEPESRVEHIGGNAFSNSRLSEIVLPASVRSIPGNPFTRMKNVRVSFAPGNTHFIAEGPMIMTADRSRLVACCSDDVTVFEVPASVTVIGEDCFTLRKIQTITFEEGSHLKKIDKHGFFESRLQRMEIPATVEEICGDAFARCECRELTIHPDNRNFVVSSPVILTFDGKKVVSCFLSFQSYQVPNGVEVIGEYSFEFRKATTINTKGARIEQHAFDSAMISQTGKHDRDSRRILTRVGIRPFL